MSAKVAAAPEDFMDDLLERARAAASKTADMPVEPAYSQDEKTQLDDDNDTTRRPTTSSAKVEDQQSWMGNEQAAGGAATKKRPNSQGSSNGIRALLYAVSDPGGDPLDDEGLTLEATVWDSALLIGLRDARGSLLSGFQTAIVIGSTATNMVVQGLIILAITNSMAKTPLDASTEDAVFTQRLFTNHRWDQIDITEMITRTARLCDGRVYSRLSELYSLISDYLTVGGTGHYTGVIVSSMAMLIWIFVMVPEFYRVCELALAIFVTDSVFPNKRKHEHAEPDSNEDCFMIRRMSKRHKIACVGLVLVPRLVMAALLLFYGLDWLAGTITIEDLILNACALEIVKTVDEYMFAALFSYRMRLLVQNTRFAFSEFTEHLPMALRRSRVWKHQEPCVMCLRVIFVAAWFTWGFYGFLDPFVKEIEAFEFNICGNDLDFAWTRHPITLLPFFTHLESTGTSSGNISVTEQLQCFYAAGEDMVQIRAGFDPSHTAPNETMREMIMGTHESCQGKGSNSCPEVMLSTLESMPSMTSAEYYMSSDCQDHDIHMMLTVEVCSQDKYAHSVPWFSGKTECQDFRNLCRCTERDSTTSLCTASQTDYWDVMDESKITYDWITRLQAICSGTCGMCARDYPSGAPSSSGPSSGSSTRRLMRSNASLDSTEGAVFMQSPDDGPRNAPEQEGDCTERMVELEQQKGELELRVAALEARNGELERRNDDMERRMVALEAMLLRPRAGGAQQRRPPSDDAALGGASGAAAPASQAAS